MTETIEFKKGEKGEATLHRMFSKMLETKAQAVECESDTGIVTLASGTYHLHLIGGTLNDGQKLMTLPSMHTSYRRVAGRMIERQI